MLITPSLNKINVIDANKDNIIYFSYTGKEQITKNTIIIEDILNGEKQYEKTISSMMFDHKIDKHSLKNNKIYRMKLQVANDNDVSELSDYIIFYTLTTPEIKFSNIKDGKLISDKNRIEVLYTQQEKEYIQSYQFTLYDANKNIIKVYSPHFQQDVMVVDNNISLTLQLSEILFGLKSLTNYYIQLQASTTKGMDIQSDLTLFSISLKQQKIDGLLNLENIKDDGTVKISVYGKKVLMEVRSEIDNTFIPYDNIKYTENEKLDLVTGNLSSFYVTTPSDFKIEYNNFTIQIWVEKIISDKIIEITGNTSNMNIWYDTIDKVFHCVVTQLDYNKKSHFISNIIDNIYMTNNKFTLFIQSLNGMIDMKAEVIQ